MILCALNILFFFVRSLTSSRAGDMPLGIPWKDEPLAFSLYFWFITIAKIISRIWLRDFFWCFSQWLIASDLFMVLIKSICLSIARYALELVLKAPSRHWTMSALSSWSSLLKAFCKLVLFIVLLIFFCLKISAGSFRSRILKRSGSSLPPLPRTLMERSSCSMAYILRSILASISEGDLSTI